MQLTADFLAPLAERDSLSLAELRLETGATDAELYAALRRGLLEKLGRGRYRVVEAGEEGSVAEADRAHHVTIKLDCSLPPGPTAGVQDQADRVMEAVIRAVGNIGEVVRVRRGLITPQR